MDKAGLKAQLVGMLTGAQGDSAEDVAATLADAMILAATTPIDPVVLADPNTVAETAEGSRDETADSIDPATGTLTADAIAKRAAAKADDDVAAAELEVAQAEESAEEGELEQAKEKLTRAQQRKKNADDALAAADAALAGEDTASGAALNHEGTGLLSDETLAGNGGPEVVDGDAGGAMVTADPNDPASQETSSGVPVTTGVVNTAEDLGG